ncbi:MAG: cupin domain-containing protein [Cyclobacteriaceae bacterium]
MKELNFAIILILLSSINTFAQKLPLPSSVYEYSMLPLLKSDFGTESRLVHWPTKTLNNFKVETFTLDAGKALAEDHFLSENEKLVLVIRGSLAIGLQEKSKVLVERSVALVGQKEQVSFQNNGTSEVSFYVVQWVSGKENGSTESYKGMRAFDYPALAFTENSKGGRRDVMEAPTQTLNELEMHITTLLEGKKSHDPHVHPDEEIILVLQGEVEEMVNGTPYRLGPGSLIFLSSMDPHGIRNIGKGTCEYYAIRWTTMKE